LGSQRRENVTEASCINSVNAAEQTREHSQTANTSSHSLLGLAAAWVCHQQGAVVLQQRLLDLHLALLVNVLLVVRDDGLADGLAQSCRGNTKADSDVRSDQNNVWSEHKAAAET
jgi:hypothetical protein